MKVPLLDIKRQIQPIRKEIDEIICKVVDQTQFILGPEVAQLETRVAELCSTQYAIGVASGTDALVIALQSMGVSEGDEVITTTYSFFATVSAIWRVGARPVLADILPDTYNIDPEEIARKITPRTKAILAVHLFGQCADMDAIRKVAGSIPIIEDAAQSIGAQWKGNPAGSLGKIGCFSFFPSKNLGAFGDGGMIVTNDSGLARKCQSLRIHGALQTYFHEEVGYNSRLDTLQAAVLLVKLPYLENWSESRRNNANFYNENFKNSAIGIPVIDPRARSIYNQYVIRVSDRDRVKDCLKSAEIGHSIYYPVPLHLQPCFRSLGYHEGDFPHAELAAKETLALPIFSELTREELDYVATTLLSAVNG